MASNEDDAVVESEGTEDERKPPPHAGAEEPDEVPSNPFSLSRETSFEDFPHPFQQALGAEYPPILQCASNPSNAVYSPAQAQTGAAFTTSFGELRDHQTYAYPLSSPIQNDDQDQKTAYGDVCKQEDRKNGEEDDRKPSPVVSGRSYDNTNMFAQPLQNLELQLPSFAGRPFASLPPSRNAEMTSPSSSSSSTRPSPPKRGRKAAPKRKSKKVKPKPSKKSPSTSPRPKNVHTEKYKPSEIEIKSAPNARARKSLHSWYDRLNDFCEYYAENGHGRVPQKYEENHALGIWVNKQREEKKKYDRRERTSLTERRISLLEGANFEWAKAKGETAWEDKFKELSLYKEENGDCDVPTKYDQNRALGRWVSAQRLSYRRYLDGEKSTLTDERVERLNELGFSWQMLQGSPQSYSSSSSTTPPSRSSTGSSRSGSCSSSKKKQKRNRR